MRDPRRIDRIVKKVAKAWGKYPDMRLIQFLLHIAKHHDLDEEHQKIMDPFYLEDRHLEEILDDHIPKPKTKIDLSNPLFRMTYLTCNGKPREAVDAFIRDIKSMTVREILRVDGVHPTSIPTVYSAKLDGYRLIFQVQHRTIKLQDIANEGMIQRFSKQKKEEKAV